MFKSVDLNFFCRQVWMYHSQVKEKHYMTIIIPKLDSPRLPRSDDSIIRSSDQH